MRPLRDYFQILWRRREVFRETFNTPSGQVVLRDMFAFCGINREALAPGQADVTAYNLGLRRYALRVAKALNMSDAEISRLANEAEERQRNGEDD